MRDHSPVDRVTAGAERRQPRIGRVTLAAITLAAAGAVGLGAAVTSVSAAAPAWGYEQLTPADGSSIDIYGNEVSQDLSTMRATTMGAPMGGMPSDGRAGWFHYGFPQGGAPWMLGPIAVGNGLQLTTTVRGMSSDGSKMVIRASLPSVDGTGGLYRVDAQGEAVNMASGQVVNTVKASADLDKVIFLSGVAPQAVYLGRAGQDPLQVSVDNDGNPMSATSLGGLYFGDSNVTYADNAVSADFSSVIFTSTDAVPGDNDGGAEDVFRRILTPGAEETILISDANDGDDPDDPARDGTDPPVAYRWATPDHRRVFFVTPESLEPGDTDGIRDLYVRDGKDAPVRVSQGETVDGAPTGNEPVPSAGRGYRPEWVMSSNDGNRAFFVTLERLTQDAPAGGVKLYERDIAEGRTRFVAGPLSELDLSTGNSDADGSLIGTTYPDVSYRGLRPTPQGAVFTSVVPLAGSPADSLRTVFVWTRGEGLKWIGKPDTDAPPSGVGMETIVAYPAFGSGQTPELNPAKGGRVVTDDGTRVFFSTSQALTAQDSDRRRDIYVWSKAEGVQLVSPPGSAPYDASYLDSSPDGSQVWFTTAEPILPSDTDPGAFDVYKATLGGGSPPSPAVPDADRQVCGGDACQGPTAGAITPIVGSVTFAGSGNVLAGPESITSSVSVSKVKAVTGSSATLKVRVPAAGQISVSGSSLRAAEKPASKAGSYSVKVALSARGKSSLRKKRSLKVRVRVAYRPSDGPAASKSVSVTFKQPKVKTSAASKKGGR